MGDNNSTVHKTIQVDVMPGRAVDIHITEGDIREQ
jgi:hypothetical protein